LPEGLGAQIMLLATFTQVLQYDVCRPTTTGFISSAEPGRGRSVRAARDSAWGHHEVTHRVQFGATPWLRPHLEGLIGRYLETVQIDSREVLSQLRRAAEAIRSGADWRGMNGILLIMNDEQRALFSRMQALMTLLEGQRRS
jgi:uncharacterized protein (DUF2342 family)